MRRDDRSFIEGRSSFLGLSGEVGDRLSLSSRSEQVESRIIIVLYSRSIGSV